MTCLRRWEIAALILTALLLATSAEGVPAWGGVVAEEGGWMTVSNPSEPAGPDQLQHPEQLWRIGADEDDVLFGLIEDALVDEDGTTYLLDTVLSTVHVVSPDGVVEREISGEGDGPGEFRFAREMVFLPGGAVGIMEMMPGKIVSVDRQGVPRPSFAFGDGGEGMMSNMSHIESNTRHVLIGSVVSNFGEGGATSDYKLAAYDGDGREIAVIRSNHIEQHGGDISLDFGGGENDFTSRFVLTPDDRVVLFPEAGGYQLDVYDVRGEPRQRIRRKYESIRRSKQELDDARKQAEAMQRRFNGSVEMEIEEWSRDIHEVVARPNGDLWVLSSEGDRDRPDQAVGWFDVFDHDGRYSHRVAFSADYDSERDFYAFDRDRLYIFKEAAKAPPRTQTMGGGGTQMVMMVASGTPDDEEDDPEEEPRPYEVICYRLPH